MSIVLPQVAISNLVAPIRNVPVGLLKAPAVAPRSLVATFNWKTDYGAGTNKPNVNVLVGMQGGGAQLPIDQIRSVKIDNLGNDFPVYVFFLDSTDTIVAPPNTVVWEPVVTNQALANVVMLGATDAGLGQTRVYFCNIVVPPYVDAEIDQAVALWKASASISKGTILQNMNYGVPCLGDQTFDDSIILNNGGSGTINFPIPATGFIYFNGFYANVIKGGGTDDGNTSVATLGVNGNDLWSWRWLNVGANLERQFPPVNNMNLKFAATDNFTLDYTGTTVAGSFDIRFVFTTNPT